MKIDLIDLMRTAEIVHPSVAKSAVLADGILKIEIHGQQWWKQTRDPIVEGRITFVFEALSEGSLDIRLTNTEWDEDEILEGFSIQRLGETAWGQPACHQIFCSGPLPRPLALYRVVEDALESADAYWTAGHYLNCAQSLSRFMELSASSSYLLANAPDSLRTTICRELERQSVRFNVLSTPRHEEKRLLVRWWEASFLCGRANAYFDD